VQLNDVLEQNKPGWSESVGHSSEPLPRLEMLVAEQGIMEWQGMTQAADQRCSVRSPILRAVSPHTPPNEKPLAGSEGTLNSIWHC